MPYYNLLVMKDLRILGAVASNREEALGSFGKELGIRLSLNEQDVPPPYLLDEWHESPHWVNPTIPVFEAQD
jgi:hypothetical protein